MKLWLSFHVKVGKHVLPCGIPAASNMALSELCKAAHDFAVERRGVICAFDGTVTNYTRDIPHLIRVSAIE